MNEANHIPDSGKKVITNGEAVRSSDWVAELEAALRTAERLRNKMWKRADEPWHIAVMLVWSLERCIEAERRRSATGESSDYSGSGASTPN